MDAVAEDLDGTVVAVGDILHWLLSEGLDCRGQENISTNVQRNYHMR